VHLLLFRPIQNKDLPKAGSELLFLWLLLCGDIITDRSDTHSDLHWLLQLLPAFCFRLYFCIYFLVVLGIGLCIPGVFSVTELPATHPHFLCSVSKSPKAGKVDLVVTAGLASMQTANVLLILIMWSNPDSCPVDHTLVFGKCSLYSLVLLALHVGAQLLWTHTALSPWSLFVALKCDVCSDSSSFLSLCNTEKYCDSLEPCLPGSPGPTEAKALKSYNSIGHEIPSPAMQLICEKGN